MQIYSEQNPTVFSEAYSEEVCMGLHYKYVRAIINIKQLEKIHGLPEWLYMICEYITCHNVFRKNG